MRRGKAMLLIRRAAYRAQGRDQMVLMTWVRVLMNEELASPIVCCVALRRRRRDEMCLHVGHGVERGCLGCLGCLDTTLLALGKLVEGEDSEKECCMGGGGVGWRL